MTRYANRQSGHVEDVAILWVRLPLWSLTTVPWSNGDDTCVTCRRRWFNSLRGHSLVCSCFSSTSLLLGYRLSSIPMWTFRRQPNGGLDHWEDSCLATRRKGFAFPAVH